MWADNKSRQNYLNLSLFLELYYNRRELVDWQTNVI